MSNVATRDAAVEDIKKHNLQLVDMNEHFKADIELWIIFLQFQPTVHIEEAEMH